MKPESAGKGRTETAWRVGRAPGALPVLGHVLPIARDPLGFLASLSAHGDLLEVRVGPWRGYVVCHPELVSQVLLDDRTFDKGGVIFEKAREFVGNGLVSCPHADHRRQRRLIQPTFHRDRMPAYAAVMSDHIDQVTGSWHDGQLIVVGREMYTVTAGVLCTSLFGTSLAETEISKLEDSVNDIMIGSARQILLPSWLHKLPTQARRRYVRANAHLSTVVHRIIDGYQSGSLDDVGMLSILLAAREEDGIGALSDTEVYDQVVTILLGGIDTTTEVLAGACHLLSRHPHIQHQLHTEVSAVLGGRAARLQDVPKLKMTGRVITETLRLYPPVWVLTRTVTRDTELAGQHLPSGTTVVVSSYLLHHRADVFADPDTFRPERWLTQASPRPSSGYLPFSTGARQCIGNDFGTIEATLALATITDRWHLTAPADTAPVKTVTRLVLGHRGPLRLHRRTALGDG
ncbi:cytochrome P450 [Streptomyces sp. GbtcB6]|uniref:cytochrome P450 n=1 Tax=Streptomyces sp. GbtcB6 TaxID=2824751 RepID=UPI001C303362|nr:cytochrome P450 [Streptomyces sp. GbtcB6]